MKKRKKRITPYSSLVWMVKAIIVFLVIILMVYPFWHVFMYSLSNSKAATAGGVFLWPKEFSLTAYKYILSQEKIYKVTFMSLAKTIVGTLLSVTLTVLMAYPLTQSDLKGKKAILLFAYFPMLFSGGIIPTYIVVRDLHLIDTFWAYVLPSAMSLFNMFLMRNYILGIPSSLKEAALLDGANHFQILTKIILPLSKASIATIALNEVRAFWNSYMDGVLYINNANMELLQVYLKRLISENGASAALAGRGMDVISTETTKMTIIAITIIPALLLYLFLQKYFVKGMTVGAVKG